MKHSGSTTSSTSAAEYNHDTQPWDPPSGLAASGQLSILVMVVSQLFDPGTDSGVFPNSISLVQNGFVISKASSFRFTDVKHTAHQHATLVSFEPRQSAQRVTVAHGVPRYDRSKIAANPSTGCQRADLRPLLSQQAVRHSAVERLICHPVPWALRPSRHAHPKYPVKAAQQISWCR